MGRHTVLIIDDDQDLRETLAQILSEFYRIVTAKNGLDGISAALEHRPSLILLDYKMPGIDGIETCRRLRREDQLLNCPIIMLTAFDFVEQRTMAYEAGADGYFAKPFDTKELLARIASAIERSQKDSAPSQVATNELRMGFLVIDLNSMRAFVSGNEIAFGPIELRIVAQLVRARGEIVSRKQLSEMLWPASAGDDRNLDPHIASIRRKIASTGCELKTVYGKGYALVSLVAA